MIAFSTCWNSSKHTDGEAMIRQILDLGFDTIELSHGMNISLLPGVQKAYAAGGFKVCGLHNYCPSPVEVMVDAPDCYEYTAHRKEERERAIKLTLKTLDFAEKFSAKYVVIHLGSVAMRRRSRELTKMVAEGQLNSREYVKLKHKLIQQREKLGPLYIKRAREALDQIAPYAEEKKIALGVESRSSYEDVPSEREMVALMKDYSASEYVGYWHDFGHVQLKANLDLLNHPEWLRKMEPYLIGGHLHDVVWPAGDHRVPFLGSIDYDKLIPCFTPEKPLVWELNPRRKEEDIRRSLPIWKERYGI